MGILDLNSPDETLENEQNPNGKFLDFFPEFKENLFPGQSKFVQSCSEYFCQSGYYERFLAKKILKSENPNSEQIQKLIKSDQIKIEDIRNEIIKQSHSLNVGYRLAKTLFSHLGVSEKSFEDYSQNVINACFNLAQKNKINIGPSIINFAILGCLDWDTQNIDLYRVFNEYFATLWQSKNYDLEDAQEFEKLIDSLKQKIDGKTGFRGEDLSITDNKRLDLEHSLKIERDFALNISRFYSQNLTNSIGEKIFGAQKIENQKEFENMPKFDLSEGESKKLQILLLSENDDKKTLLKGQKEFFISVCQAIWSSGYFQKKYEISNPLDEKTKNHIIGELNPLVLAYVFVKQSYREKNRKSRERFFEHFKGVIDDYIGVSKISGEQVTPQGILIRLLHDIKEDGLIDTTSLTYIFGEKIASQVDNLAKKSYIEYIEGSNDELSQKFFIQAKSNIDSRSKDEKDVFKKNPDQDDFVINLAKNYRDDQYFGKYQQIGDSPEQIEMNFETFLAKIDDRINNLSTLQDVGAESQINQLWQTIKYFYPACQNYINYFEKNSLKEKSDIMKKRFAILHTLVRYLLNIFINKDNNLDYGKGLDEYISTYKKIETNIKKHQNIDQDGALLKDSKIFQNQVSRIDDILGMLYFIQNPRENTEFLNSDFRKDYILGENNLKYVYSQRDEIIGFVKNLLIFRHKIYEKNKQKKK